jgi:hypothetical protein
LIQQEPLFYLKLKILLQLAQLRHLAQVA